MNQMGHALQHLPADATLSESQRMEQVRMIVNLEAYASHLHSPGTELERQHLLTIQRAQAKVQQISRCHKTPRFSIRPSRNEP